ncbi:hypothetical protein AV926_09595 [Myroides marinus]|uniref:Uncharacterized protein n=1 Tax=Myroides marinus TaxID=703342 RepID=A0A161SHN8_9FLAO|nr:hypothetical protein [Myroides marinus]KZE81015.1 hypothetical protein AV926_09595 [Myroides marinus]
MIKNNKMVLSYVLKHQQNKNLDEIVQILEENKFWEVFPPKEVEVLSWQVLIGLGHVVTLAFNPELLRTVNLSIEKGAWGAFDTTAYATYDYMNQWKSKKE